MNETGAGSTIEAAALDRRAVDPGNFDPDALAAALGEVDPTGRPRRDEVVVVRAPGRVNLIGEHTDYNDGFVLPAAIDLEIRIALLPTDDRHVELTLIDSGERAGFDLDDIRPASGSWIDYVAGPAWALREAGVPMHGFRGVLASSLPQSSGLSSSAAMGLVSVWALTAGTGGSIDGMTRARLCQRAENGYVGANTGLMDEFASSLGVRGAALFLDCRSLAWRPVPLPLETHRLVVCHTGSQRRLRASEYNARRAQCEAAVTVLARDDPSIRALRDVTPEVLPLIRGQVDDTTYRRCRHVVLENERVLAAIDALGAGDLAAVGRLFAASHDSLRDDFEVSSPELDALVDIARSTPGVAAARMTGAGFGGCTVNLVEREAVDALREAVEREYPARTGLRPRVFAVEPADGAGRLA